MHEHEVADQLVDSDVTVVVSLPCDKNKGFTDLVHEMFDVIDVTREEDGVGVSAGLYLGGTRSVMSIQSSGIGNMMNAMMSLTACYRMPLVILASWRGVDDERIEAQKYFNTRIPELLDVYGIGCWDVSSAEDIPKVGEAVRRAFSENTMEVVLIHPKMWGDSKRINPQYPSRARHVGVLVDKDVPEPVMTRLQAIGAMMSAIGPDDIVVSNIGVPSKETFASGDRPMNFYMLGSYTQASAIGLGLALATDRRVFVVDGDGSMLGSSVFPVLAQYRPENLTILCVDNGTFGSTGNQINPSYSCVDMGAVAAGFGLDPVTVSTEDGVREAVSREGFGFVQAMIVPGNSDSPNISMTAVEIRDRFMGAL